MSELLPKFASFLTPLSRLSRMDTFFFISKELSKLKRDTSQPLYNTNRNKTNRGNLEFMRKQKKTNL